MAKKGQAIQLQTEVNNDEEWEKLLQRDGLIVVDVYSEWCGPCSGMTATLKKLKLEIGGDILQLAIAKADKITALERFRNKSEPTWMFISNGKMVNFMFGANAPKLTRLITEEVNKENETREGKRERISYEISDLADEEKERMEVVESQIREAREKEEARAAKELYDRRTAESNQILENLHNLGVILIFPHARTTYQEAFGDLLGEAGLAIQQTEKVDITLQNLEELFYFVGEISFDEESVEELINSTSIILLIKGIHSRTEEETVDESILRIVYGDMRKAPGSPDSMAKILTQWPQASSEEIAEKKESMGIWTPEDEMIKATFLRLFFQKLTAHLLIPEPEPTPPHYAVIFEAMRRHELLPLMEKYSTEILRYGFFNSEVPEEAELIAKSIKKFEQILDRTTNEKLVIQLSKKKSECVLSFVQLKPLYVSPNAIEGKRECSLFFPDDYDEPDEVEEEPIEAEEASVTQSRVIKIEEQEQKRESKATVEIEETVIEEEAGDQEATGEAVTPNTDQIVNPDVAPPEVQEEIIEGPADNEVPSVTETSPANDSPSPAETTENENPT